MTPGFAGLFSIAALLTVPLAGDAGQVGRPRTDPVPAGQRVQAQDGDVVVVENDARVKIIHRREATVRAIYNSAQHWLVLLVDFASPGNPADGRVDWTYTYNDLIGNWPLGDRWEGAVILEDYSMAGGGAPSGLGIVSPQGLVQFVNSATPSPFLDPGAAAVLRSRRAGHSSAGRTSFDQEEGRQVQDAIRNAERPPGTPAQFSGSSSMGFTTGLSVGVSGGVVSNPPAPDAPVRVGGNIRAPIKIVDVRPVMPDKARDEGISGVVIMEVTIDVDGFVKAARVLRSIPLLDEAALAAVRQWRYEPTLLNGQPVPVIMTATVAF